MLGQIDAMQVFPMQIAICARVGAFVLTLSLFSCGGGLTPVAPTAETFMWPSRQTDFLQESGKACTGRVALAVGITAVCFNAIDDRLRCAGRIGGTDIGLSFVDFGIGAVDQIIFHRGSVAGPLEVANVCVRTTANAVYCRGSNAPAASSAWTQWGDPADAYVAIASDSMTKICAMNACGAIRCSDFAFANATLSSAGHTRFFVEPTANLRIDDLTFFRMQNGPPYCAVRASGLTCYYSNPGFGGPWGTPGTVVDGTIYAGPEPDLPDSLGFKVGCWLSSTGAVRCRSGATTVSRFGSQTMLAIAGDIDTTALCGVSNDGALFCRGSHARLGNGTGAPASDTEVAPPGTVFVGCGKPVPGPPVHRPLGCYRPHP